MKAAGEKYSKHPAKNEEGGNINKANSETKSMWRSRRKLVVAKESVRKSENGINGNQQKAEIENTAWRRRRRNQQHRKQHVWRASEESEKRKSKKASEENSETKNCPTVVVPAENDVAKSNHQRSINDGEEE